MALPTLGETYSLLADVRTTEFRNQREEERQYRKDARRDQLKAALLQPIIGAAATTGMKVIGDVVGGAFLGSNAVKKVTQQEQFRRLKTDLEFQDQAKSEIAKLAAKVTNDPAKFKEEQIKRIRNQLAIDDYNQINYEDLSTEQKHNISQRISNSDFLSAFDKNQKKLIDNIKKLNTSISTQFDSAKVARFIKENPDLYSTKSGGEKIFTSLVDKLASFIPGKEDRNRMRESYSIKLYGTKDEESLTPKQIKNLDWIMGSTKEGTPIEGQGASNFAKFQEYRNQYNDINSNFYQSLKTNKGDSKIGENISLDLSMLQNAETVAQDGSNPVTDDYFRQRRTFYNNDMHLNGRQFNYRPGESVLKAADITDSDSTNIVVGAGSENLERYNQKVEELVKLTGLTENQITETLQNNIFPILTSSFRDSLDDMFKGKTFKGNAFNTIGSLNERQVQTLLGEFLVTALEENVVAVGADEGFKFGFGGIVFEIFEKQAEGAIRIGIDNKSELYRSNNTKRILSLLGQEDQYIENKGSTNIKTRIVSNSTNFQKENLIQKDPYDVQVENVIGIVSNTVQKMKEEKKSIDEINKFLIEQNKIFKQRLNKNGIALSEEDLQSLDEQFDSLSEGMLKGYQPPSVNPRGRQRSPQSGTGVGGLLSNPVLAFSKRRLRNQLENLENNPQSPQEFFKFFDPLDLSFVTPEVMQEVGYSDEFIEYAQQRTQDTSDSLLNDPNEKISIDSVLETAFEKQSLNPITIDLFTDNPNGMTLPAVESAASLSVADRSNLTSDHDAHGITQVKVSTAIQPGYNTPNIFKVADSLGVTYDEDLAQEAMAITAKGAVSQQKMTEEEGPAWQQVVDLLRNPEVNVRLGALYFNNLLKNYNNNPVKAVIAYNAGPVVSNSFTGDRSILRQETQDYLSKMGL